MSESSRAKLSEIDQIEGDYAKRRYYQELIKQANLNANALRDVLRQVARDISSDYEQAQLLIAVAPMLTGKEAAIQPFFDAVAIVTEADLLRLGNSSPDAPLAQRHATRKTVFHELTSPIRWPRVPRPGDPELRG